MVLISHPPPFVAPPYSPPPYPQAAQGAPYPTAPGAAYSAAPYPPSGMEVPGGPPPHVGFAMPFQAQPPGYPTYPVPSTTVYIQQQPTALPITVVSFGRDPIMFSCPHCRHYGLTSVERKAGCLAWLLCAIICLFGFWFGCCLIPFCVDAVNDFEHRCSGCRRIVGHYSPM
ncbi:hypothetical protein EG68_03762 [Paragonimus skrjabini miyazakii]|uniref:LITAF domain-containing protein n=1 Tax=Paragonimus skrjabini miyazakii TaxID=59628 RepID=A0A8S9YVA8_9TREM|nr:hypothetical protein EG68_03762 [Paragonimus skrjabini miyazakii]